MALPQPVKLTLFLCKLFDTAEPILDMLLLGTVVFMGRFFLVRVWHICFAQHLLLVVAQFPAGAVGCIPAAEAGCSVESLTR